MSRWTGLPIVVAMLALPNAVRAESDGRVYWTSYLRAGPGPQFAALDEVPARSLVTVEACRAGWCRVVFGGAAGYLEQARLAAPDIHAPVPAATPTGPCADVRVNGTADGEALRVCGR